VNAQDDLLQDDSELLTGDVAREAGKSSATVRLWERLGKLRARKTAGGVRIFSGREVREFLRQRQISAGAKPQPTQKTAPVRKKARARSIG
jgi:DNA-binding transcriptional MerR regulator